MIAHEMEFGVTTERALEPQLGQAAVLVVYARPEQGAAAAARESDRACSPGPATDPNAFAVRCELRRMEAMLPPVTRAAGVRVKQFVGEPAGRFSSLGALYSSKPAWEIEAGTRAIPFDTQHTWWVSFTRCLFEFGPHWTFEGSAAGETYPVLANGQTVLLADAAGTLTGVSEKAGGLCGVFSMNGRLTADGEFHGTICCRIPDPGGVILRDREISVIEAQRDPNPQTTLLVLRGSGVKGTAEIRGAEYLFTTHGHPGFRAASNLGPSLGALDAEVMSDFSTCGTVGSPAEFSANYAYRFLDRSGEEVASLGARALDGRMFDFRMPGASHLRAITYAGTGPVVSGTGYLAGARGQFSVLGSRSVAPAAFVETALINLYDPQGRLRESGRHRHPEDAAAPSPLRQYLPMVGRLDELAEQHRQWRWSMRGVSDVAAKTIAARYAELSRVGSFEGIALDPAFMKSQFEANIAPFNPVVFERYTGAARGEFAFYSQATRQQTGGNVLYSYWNPSTYRFGARYCKFITGSFQRYFRPDEVPDFSTHQVDPIVNSYRDDVGVISYIMVYQGKAPGLYQERTSFAYKMPGPHEVLWLVKDLIVDGKPAPPDIFMSSHEWKEVTATQTRYLMVGMFWKIDFVCKTIDLGDDMFWKTVYVEDHGQL